MNILSPVLSCRCCFSRKIPPLHLPPLYPEHVSVLDSIPKTRRPRQGVKPYWQSSCNTETGRAACILHIYCKCVHTPRAVFVCYQEGINPSDLEALVSHVGKGKGKKRFLAYNFLLWVAFCENYLSILTSEVHTYLCSVFISEEQCVCRSL